MQYDIALSRSTNWTRFVAVAVVVANLLVCWIKTIFRPKLKLMIRSIPFDKAREQSAVWAELSIYLLADE